MKAGKYRSPWGLIAAVIILVSAAVPIAFTQSSSSQTPDAIAIHGTILDSANKPVADALITLERSDRLSAAKTKTNPQGTFVFSDLEAGNYTLSAEKSGLRARAVVQLSKGDRKQIDLALDAPGPSSSNSSSPEAMEFADQPNFTVAGVTDWTAVGGHGSDTSLRSSEALARETLTLKPGAPGQSSSVAADDDAEGKQSESALLAALAKAPGSFEANHQLGEFYCHHGRYREAVPLLQTSSRIDPANHGNDYALALAYRGSGDLSRAREQVRKMLAHQDNAELHGLAGALDEQLGDPLAAVREEEQAVRLDPSEPNYFEWGSELLLHRALRPAVEVFEKGAGAHPKSARMLAALGAALFASGSYEEAARRVCDASDLGPADPAPYLFMGKIEVAAPQPLPCVEQKLARFAQQQPANALANYYYAMSIWKRQPPGDQHNLQQVEMLLNHAITIDPSFDDAYLQLGILSFAQHHFEQAIGFYNSAIEANPQLGAAHYRLGVAYERMGEREKAKHEFQLHEQIEKQQAAAVEQQRREVKQFMVVLKSQPASPPAQ